MWRVLRSDLGESDGWPAFLGSAQDGVLPEQPRLLVRELQRVAG
ncbi:MAG: hypothetical protein WAM44_21940 [Chthoniobacterales bacterium]